MRIRRRLRRDRYFGYVMGPVFIFLNKGLSDEDVDYLTHHIILDGEEPRLIVERFEDMMYEPSDP